MSQGDGSVLSMERTGVLSRAAGFGGARTSRATDPAYGAVAVAGPSVWELLDRAGEALRSVSLEGLTEDELSRVVAETGRVKSVSYTHLTLPTKRIV